MHRISFVGLLALGLALACTGPTDDTKGTVDTKGVAQLEAALRTVEPSMSVPIFIQGASESGLVTPPCAEALSTYANADPAIKVMVMGRMLVETSLRCPSTCGGGNALLEEAGRLEAVPRAALVTERCDAEGPDPVFGGPLAPLRTATSTYEYLLVRELAVRATEASPTFADLYDELAVGLALNGAVPGEPAPELQVTGSREVDPATFTALVPALAACSDRASLKHRLVIDPSGTVVAVAGQSSCMQDALRTLKFPATPDWSWVDASWAVLYPEPGEAPTP